MKLYTSYFYQIRNFPRNLIPLSTAVWNPKYTLKDSTGQPALLIDCPPLKPGIECDGLCDGKCANKTAPNCKFLQTYRKQLEAIDKNAFMSKLEQLKAQIEKGENLTDVNFAFIVFETPKNKCSERWAIQNWLGNEVSEWTK